MEMAWSLGQSEKQRQYYKTSITLGTTGPQRKGMIKDHLEERAGKGQRASSTAGGKWRRQCKTELDGQERFVAYVPVGVTRH